MDVEGPSKAPDKLPAGSVYNMIGKVDLEIENLQPANFIPLPDHAETELVSLVSLFVQHFHDKSKETLHDDQACLLALTVYVVGLPLPEELKKYLGRRQEVHGLARWLTTASPLVVCVYMLLLSVVQISQPSKGEI